MGIKIIDKNKRASYDFAIKDTYEAGLVLRGTEVKSLRTGKAKISESYINIRDGEAFLVNMYIPHYEFGNRQNHKEDRQRKLLLNKKEIEQIAHKIKTDSLTVIPTKLYFKDRRVKIEIALAKGKKLYDKRQDTAKKDIERKLKQGKWD